jgi:pSer/pThr/pTyr-binding forkhead associated (FHA) protein
LGVITFDDGSSVALEDDYVLGREPESDADVVAGRARPLVVDDPDRTMSRVHATIALDGWTVLLTDRGAANGTYVSGPGQDGWVALFPNQPTALKRGSRVRLGDREFRFDAMNAQH